MAQGDDPVVLAVARRQLYTFDELLILATSSGSVLQDGHDWDILTSWQCVLWCDASHSEWCDAYHP